MPKTLLLADDSVTIQKVVGLTFASEDITLVNVDNGDDALARARELRPDLVLADVVMPGRNGYEVCEAIKADTALRHIPVLLLSGTFETFDEERARIAGADGHITKPFEAQALIETVHRLLAKPLPAVVRAVAGTDTGPVVSTPSRVESHGDASFDFFDDDLLESSNAFGSSAGSATTASSRSASAGATPSPSPSHSTPASVDSGLSRGASGTTTAPSFNSTSGSNERTVLDLREEEAFDLAEAEEDDDVVAATEALFEDDVDLGASIGAPTLDDEEPFDPGFDEAPRPPLPPARLDDPLEALAHSGGSSAPRDAAPLGHDTDISWPDLGAQPHDAALDARLGSSEFDISFRDTSFRGTSAAGTAGFGQSQSAKTEVQPIATSLPVTADAFATPLDAELPAAVAVDSEEDALFADFDAAPFEAATAISTAGFVTRDVFDTRPDAGVSFADDDPLSELSFAGTLSADEETPLAFPAPDVAAPARPFAAPTRPVSPMNETTGARTAPPTTVPPDLGPLLRQRVHDTLEKVAWEAFADLSDTIVRQVVERVESIAWEVIPQMAEAIVREEIRRMKGSEE